MNKQLLTYLHLSLLIVPLTVLTSCDAMLQMSYTVANKTRSEIKLFIPDFPTDSVFSIYGTKQDTTITIQPNEEIVVGIGSKIDFPWGTKNIYRNQPGICGMKIISDDTIIDLSCTKAEWKYRRQNSKMKLR